MGFGVLINSKMHDTVPTRDLHTHSYWPELFFLPMNDPYFHCWLRLSYMDTRNDSSTNPNICLGVKCPPLFKTDGVLHTHKAMISKYMVLISAALFRFFRPFSSASKFHAHSFTEHMSTAAGLSVQMSFPKVQEQIKSSCGTGWWLQAGSHPCRAAAGKIRHS